MASSTRTRSGSTPWRSRDQSAPKRAGRARPAATRSCCSRSRRAPPIANVAVEVRAIDDDGAMDPTPARTVFPIRNSAPTFRLARAESPPDTTWPVVSFAFARDDLDGEANLAGIEIALNDTLAGFVRLPADIDFITLVADDPGAAETEARALLGGAGSPRSSGLPGLRTDAPNMLYLRSVDAAEFRSATAVYPDPDPDAGETWYVRRVTSRVLLVNDFRASRNDPVLVSPRDPRRATRARGLTTSGTSPSRSRKRSTQPAGLQRNLPSTPDPTLRRRSRSGTASTGSRQRHEPRRSGTTCPLVAGVLDDSSTAAGASS